MLTPDPDDGSTVFVQVGRRLKDLLDLGLYGIPSVSRAVREEGLEEGEDGPCAANPSSRLPPSRDVSAEIESEGVSRISLRRSSSSMVCPLCPSVSPATTTASLKEECSRQKRPTSRPRLARCSLLPLVLGSRSHLVVVGDRRRRS
jgi:hypothetical protein